MATLYKMDGTQEEVQPKNGKDFKLDELYEMLECKTIEAVYFSGREHKGQIMIIDEEGKLPGPPTYTPKPLNEAATVVFKTEPRLPGDYIAGAALLCLKKELK